MSNSPQSERDRLARNYASMPDLQLAEIADEGDTLTNVARDALRNEIAKRGLDIEVREPSDRETPPPPNLVTIRHFLGLPEALIAKGALDSAGIASFLADANIVRMDWFYSNAVGGVKLQVRQDNVEEANRILDQEPPSEFDVEGQATYEQPRCPKCNSLDVSHDPLHGIARASLAATWLTGVVPPIPLHVSGWRCNSCGHFWHDESAPDASR